MMSALSGYRRLSIKKPSNRPFCFLPAGGSRNSKRESWGFLGPIAIPRPRVEQQHTAPAMRLGLATRVLLSGEVNQQPRHGIRVRTTPCEVLSDGTRSAGAR